MEKKIHALKYRNYFCKDKFSSIVNEAIKTNSVCFKKNFSNTKNTKQVKLINKIKTSKY